MSVSILLYFKASVAMSASDVEMIFFPKFICSGRSELTYAELNVLVTLLSGWVYHLMINIFWSLQSNGTETRKKNIVFSED